MLITQSSGLTYWDLKRALSWKERYKDLSTRDLAGNRDERHHSISSHALKETKTPIFSDSHVHRNGISVRLTPEEHAKTNNYRFSKESQFSDSMRFK